jgi:hypothetical protein
VAELAQTRLGVVLGLTFGASINCGASKAVRDGCIARQAAVSLQVVPTGTLQTMADTTVQTVSKSTPALHAQPVLVRVVPIHTEGAIVLGTTVQAVGIETRAGTTEIVGEVGADFAVSAVYNGSGSTVFAVCHRGRTGQAVTLSEVALPVAGLAAGVSASLAAWISKIAAHTVGVDILDEVVLLAGLAGEGV